MYHEFMKIDLLRKEDVPADFPQQDANVLRITCHETQNVLFCKLRAMNAAADVRRQLASEEDVEFAVETVRFEFHGNSGTLHHRDMRTGFLPAQCRCRKHGDAYECRFDFDHHALSLLVVGAMWFAQYQDFRLIEFLCVLDPWGFHHASQKLARDWGEGIEVEDARRRMPPRYDIQPMTIDDFSIEKLLIRMKEPKAPVYYSELLAWVYVKPDTMIKYLKESGVARENAQMKGWFCTADDIIQKFVPYIESVPKCLKQFFNIPDDLREAGMLPPSGENLRKG